MSKIFKALVSSQLRRSLCTFSLVSASVFNAQGVQAQANYDGALIGGRSALLGGTGVAAGTDAAAPLQNPATTIDIVGTSFVFSTLFLQVSGRSIKVNPQNIELIRSGSTNLNETVLGVLPNSTCLFISLSKEAKHPRDKGRQKLSICLTQPESNKFSLNSQALANTQNDDISYLNHHLEQDFSKHTYAVGWGYGVSNDVSIGFTPLLHDIKFQDLEQEALLNAQTSELDSLMGAQGQNLANTLSRSARSLAASALLGARYQPAKDWKLGFSFETPSIALPGRYYLVRSSEAVASTSEQYVQQEGKAKFNYPLRLALGIAGKVGGVFFEFDAYFHGARKRFLSVSTDRVQASFSNDTIDSFTESSVSFVESARSVANFGLGVEVPLVKDWSLLFGALTDISGLARFDEFRDPDTTLFRSRTNAVNASLGVGWTPRIGSILCGLRGFYADGQLAVSDARLVPSRLKSFDQNRWGLALVLSGQLSLEMLAVVDPTGLVKKTESSSTNQVAE